MPDVKCEFCNSTFSKKSNLLTHQKTAKFCLSLQGKENNDFICQYCEKKLSSKHSLTAHLSSCQKRVENNPELLLQENIELKQTNLLLSENIKSYEKEIAEKNRKIEKLENHIMKLSEKPRTTNNINNNQRYSQIINNLSPITDENFEELSSKLELKHITNGAHGYIALVKENFGNKLLCTDVSRKNMKFKDKNNNIITDINGTEFTFKFFNSIKEARQYFVELQKNEAKTELEKIQAVLHFGKEDAAIASFLKRREETPFSNKFISVLSSYFYIKNKQNNISSDDSDNDDNEIEYLIVSD
jgi:hypothetical protein